MDHYRGRLNEDQGMNRLESGHPNEFVCRLKTLWESRTTFHFDGNVQNRPSEIGPLSKDAFLYAQTGMRLLDSRIRDRRPQILDGQPQPYLFPLLFLLHSMVWYDDNELFL